MLQVKSVFRYNQNLFFSPVNNKGYETEKTVYQAWLNSGLTWEQILLIATR